MVLRKYFFLPACPLKEACMGVRNPPKLWGWSVDQAEAVLRHHLVH